MSTPVQENNFNFNNSPNQNAQSPLEFSYSHSVNTISSVRDYIISEDLMAGQRLDGRMSNVRRFFCLFVTFDFLFTSLMWLICVMKTDFTCAYQLLENNQDFNMDYDILHTENEGKN